jgi:predicted RNA-binding Zn ribbon-like protein
MADDQFILLGDAIWLDFVNTSRGRTAPPPDLLADYSAYACWSRTLQLDTGSDAAGFPAVRRFRDQLTLLAEALHAERPAPGGAIAAINELLARSGGRQHLIRVSGDWKLHFVPARPATAMESIARSAAVTLADRLTKVRRCAGEQCSLYFADDSPSGSRRWCDPGVCGRDVRIERRRGILR